MVGGFFLTLNFEQTSASSSVTKPNFAVRLNTVSAESAFRMVGGFFLLEKTRILGFEASELIHESTLSLVIFVEWSGIILESFPTIALLSILPSYVKAGKGLIGYNMIFGVS